MAQDRTARAGDLTRRALLGAAASLCAGMAVADLRPVARPAAPSAAPATRPSVSPRLRREIADMVRAAGLEGRAGIAVADARTGTLLDAHAASDPIPPASVMKALTALYALEHLDPSSRFATRLVATGPVEGGILRGDLVLAGGGDPTLTTDQLADLAAALRQAGITDVSGRFLTWGGALPHARLIDDGQPPHVAYNPGVSGLNLNFNRIFFEWARRGDGTYRTGLDARGDRHRPAVSVATISVEPRSLPVYTYEDRGGIDAWTVARGQLGEAGSRWLPVRDPERYAGEAFRALAEAQGVALPAPARAEAEPEGEEIARHESAPLVEIAREMLLYSTNLTAEVLGLAASRARGLDPAGPRESAAAMARWLMRRTGAQMRLLDHSGLSADSRIAPIEMAIALASPGVMDLLRPILREHPLTDANGERIPMPPALVRAKTGTLNFVSTLAGYARTTPGADLAFAIFVGDPERRAAAAAASDEEIPPGSRDFNARARRLQQMLLQRWGVIGPDGS